MFSRLRTSGSVTQQMPVLTRDASASANAVFEGTLR